MSYPNDYIADLDSIASVRNKLEKMEELSRPASPNAVSSKAIRREIREPAKALTGESLAQILRVGARAWRCGTLSLTEHESYRGNNGVVLGAYLPDPSAMITEFRRRYGNGRFGETEMMYRHAALKIMRLDYAGHEEEIMRIIGEDSHQEVVIESNSNVITLIEQPVSVRSEDGMIYLLIPMPFMSRTLENVLNLSSYYYDQTRIASFNNPNHYSFVTYLVLRGLRYLHSKNIVHRDIKMDNIMCCSLHDYVNYGNAAEIPDMNVFKFCKIIDFGGAAIIGKSDIEFYTTLNTGAPMYRAPETYFRLHEMRTPSRSPSTICKLDVWSAMVMSIEISLNVRVFALRTNYEFTGSAFERDFRRAQCGWFGIPTQAQRKALRMELNDADFRDLSEGRIDWPTPIPVRSVPPTGEAYTPVHGDPLGRTTYQLIEDQLWTLYLLAMALWRLPIGSTGDEEATYRSHSGCTRLEPSKHRVEDVNGVNLLVVHPKSSVLVEDLVQIAANNSVHRGAKSPLCPIKYPPGIEWRIPAELERNENRRMPTKGMYYPFCCVFPPSFIDLLVKGMTLCPRDRLSSSEAMRAPHFRQIIIKDPFYSSEAGRQGPLPSRWRLRD